jgi:hypothetical protein
MSRIGNTASNFFSFSNAVKLKYALFLFFFLCCLMTRFLAFLSIGWKQHEPDNGGPVQQQRFHSPAPRKSPTYSSSSRHQATNQHPAGEFCRRPPTNRRQVRQFHAGAAAEQQFPPARGESQHVCWALLPGERSTELVQHFAHRGSSHRRKGAVSHIIHMVWLHRSPIPVGRGRGVFYLFK